MKKTKKKKPGPRILKAAALIASTAVAAAAVAGALYCYSLSQRIEKRFSGRRWRIPSRVYSDTAVLYPGQSVNRRLFDEKLLRLGYRTVSSEPRRSGELRASEGAVEIFLRESDHPGLKRSPDLVRISFSEDRIDSIERLSDKSLLSLLELEPEELMRFYGPDHERRQVIALDQVPRHLIRAVLSAEDKRFYRHHGFDPLGILRAVRMNLRHGTVRAGGSTITQQLSKCYFLTSQRTLRRKIKELFMAVTLEVMCSKDEILAMYLNEIYLGQKGAVAIHGVAEAAMFYFGKPVGDLSLPESAALAGLIQAPNRYSPYESTERCKARRNRVLLAMHTNRWIDDNELSRALASAVVTAGYTVNEKRAGYFMDYVSKQMRDLYSEDVLSSQGLSVYTTLDTQVQMAAEWALEQGLSRLEASNPDLIREPAEKRLQGAIIVMQPRSGAILALVGGRNYHQSQFNRITRARRQPGSAFKPFVYLSALDTFQPTSMLSNEPRSYSQGGDQWSPKNAAPVKDSRVTLQRALAESINLPAVDLAIQVGLEAVIDTASAFGFSTRIAPYPSLALGSFEVIPLELARAYCAFAADGVLPYPLSVKEVTDDHGQILERRYMEIERVTTPAKAFIMSSLLRRVVTRGTARSLAKLGMTLPAAGKTGTSNDYRDAWFIGYTPEILALVWVGFDDGSSLQASSTTAALPIWAYLMKAIPQHLSGSWFNMPPGVSQLSICSKSGQLAVKNACPQTTMEFFLTDNAPGVYCRLHQKSAPVKRFLKGIYDFFK